MRFAADFGPKISKFFRGRKKIARDRAEIRAGRGRAAVPRAFEVPKHCAERPHAAACEIACDLNRLSDRKFRKKFAAAKFCV